MNMQPNIYDIMYVEYFSIISYNISLRWLFSTSPYVLLNYYTNPSWTAIYN